MNPCIQARRRFRIDIGPLAYHTAERCLDVGAWAAEPVVKIEMAKGGVHVVPPHQTHHPAAEPDAFRVAGRAGDQTGRLGEFVDLSLGLFGRIRRLGRRRFVAAFGIAALGEALVANEHRRRREQDG